MICHKPLLVCKFVLTSEDAVNAFWLSANFSILEHV